MSQQYRIYLLSNDPSAAPECLGDFAFNDCPQEDFTIFLPATTEDDDGNPIATEIGYSVVDVALRPGGATTEVCVALIETKPMRERRAEAVAAAAEEDEPGEPSDDNADNVEETVGEVTGEEDSPASPTNAELEKAAKETPA